MLTILQTRVAESDLDHVAIFADWRNAIYAAACMYLFDTRGWIKPGPEYAPVIRMNKIRDCDAYPDLADDGMHEYAMEISYHLHDVRNAVYVPALYVVAICLAYPDANVMRFDCGNGKTIHVHDIHLSDTVISARDVTPQ